MARIPEQQRLLTEQLIEDQEIEEESRSYLGISSIGEKCPRKIWYNFRLVKKKNITAKQKRLFSRGHREEPIVIEDLKSIGIKVDSKQASVTSGNGHIKGHRDGLVSNVPDAPKTDHLLEIKTANDSNFKKICKDGIRSYSEIYYGQIVCYMYLFGLTRTLYIVVNKNNDQRYYKRIKEDTEHAKYLLNRGLDIISSEVPPPRIGNASFFACKFCDFYDICHYDEKVNRNCRTCKSADIYDEGEWGCAIHDITLSFSQQLIGCGKYELLLSLR